MRRKEAECSKRLYVFIFCLLIMGSCLGIWISRPSGHLLRLFRPIKWILWKIIKLVNSVVWKFLNLNYVNNCFCSPLVDIRTVLDQWGSKKERGGERRRCSQEMKVDELSVLTLFLHSANFKKKRPTWLCSCGALFVKKSIVLVACVFRKYNASW